MFWVGCCLFFSIARNFSQYWFNKIWVDGFSSIVSIKEFPTRPNQQKKRIERYTLCVSLSSSPLPYFVRNPAPERERRETGINGSVLLVARRSSLSPSLSRWLATMIDDSDSSLTQSPCLSDPMLPFISPNSMSTYMTVFSYLILRVLQGA